ncbi:MAG: RNA polymerase Rpb4 family protein [Thermoplasmatota archaeon]
MDDIILDDIVEDGRLVSLAEVKAMLEEAQEKREEFTYEQKIAFEHATRFARIDVDTANKIIDEVKAAFPAVDEKYAYKVADLCPQHPDDVIAVFQRSGHDFTDDDAQKVIAIVDKYYVA